MPQIRTRTYTYTGQSSMVAGTCSLALSEFTASGDAQPISEILSIKVKYYRYHDTSSNVGHTAQLVFANGSSAITSAKVTKRGDGATFAISNVFSAMPAAADFTTSNVTLKTYPDTKKDHVFWMATSARPITITITYYSSEFKPSISNVKLYRANDLGAAADEGTYVTFQARLKVSNAGTSGTGTLKLYAVDAASKSIADGTLVFTQTGISGSTSGVTITKAPISGYTLAIGVSQYFKLQFSYTAKTSTGAESTETIESAAIYVGNVFTNMHLAGVPTGGVCFGGFSRSTLNNPKLESYYPAHLYGGIANIQAGEVASVGATAGGATVDIDATFPIAFARGTTPYVVVGFKSTSTAGTFGRCAVAVMSATNTGFTFRFFNGDSSNRAPEFTYIAFGIPA